MRKTIKLTESDLTRIVKRVIKESDFTVEPEIGTIPREKDIKSMFGQKYGAYIPMDVLRYMRKNPALIFKRLYDIYGDKSYDYLDKAKGTDDLMESSHDRSDRYMFFSNLEQMRRQCGLLLDLDHDMVEGILDEGHDWAQDHIAEAKNNLDQVFDFMMNETKQHGMELSMDIEDGDMVMMESEISEKKKKNIPTNPSLWQSSLDWAKSRYKVCPSAFCNGAATKRYNSKGGKWKKG
jgi:hypothetical protein